MGIPPEEHLALDFDTAIMTRALVEENRRREEAGAAAPAPGDDPRWSLSKTIPVIEAEDIPVDMTSPGGVIRRG